MKRERMLRIRLTGEEAERLDKERGTQTASEYARARIFEKLMMIGSSEARIVLRARKGLEAFAVPAEEPRRDFEPALATVKARKRERKPLPKCCHGVEKGRNCWQCGGLAAIQS